MDQYIRDGIPAEEALSLTFKENPLLSLSILYGLVRIIPIEDNNIIYARSDVPSHIACRLIEAITIDRYVEEIKKRVMTRDIRKNIHNDDVLYCYTDKVLRNFSWDLIICSTRGIRIRTKRDGSYAIVHLAMPKFFNHDEFPAVMEFLECAVNYGWKLERTELKEKLDGSMINVCVVGNLDEGLIPDVMVSSMGSATSPEALHAKDLSYEFDLISWLPTGDTLVCELLQPNVNVIPTKYDKLIVLNAISSHGVPIDSEALASKLGMVHVKPLAHNIDLHDALHILNEHTPIEGGVLEYYFTNGVVYRIKIKTICYLAASSANLKVNLNYTMMPSEKMAKMLDQYDKWVKRANPPKWYKSIDTFRAFYKEKMNVGLAQQRRIRMLNNVFKYGIVGISDPNFLDDIADWVRCNTDLKFVSTLENIYIYKGDRPDHFVKIYDQFIKGQNMRLLDVPAVATFVAQSYKKYMLSE